MLIFLVCSNPRTWFWEWRLQVRMPSRIRVSIWGFNYVLRWSIGWIRISEYHEWQGNTLWFVQMSLSWCCRYESSTRSHLWCLLIVTVLYSSKTAINLLSKIVLCKGIAISRKQKNLFKLKRRKFKSLKLIFLKKSVLWIC